jgi:chromosome segregation ATPase
MNRSSPEKTTEQQAIEELQSRYDQLSHERTRIGTQRETAQKQLETLQSRAVKEFGTADLEELEKQLQAMKLENEKKRAEYQASLERVERDLSEIETKFAGRESASGEE